MENNLDYKGNKGFRLMAIYEKLSKGELLKKPTLAQNYGVSEKTIQRDIDDLRAYLQESHPFEAEIRISYDRVRHGYYLVKFERDWLTNQEVLGVCKILLESRGFNKEEMEHLLDKLLMQAVPSERTRIEELIRSEMAGFVPLRHGKLLLDIMWNLSMCISDRQLILIKYRRQDGECREHRVKPVGIMFSEYYFYLISYMEDDNKDGPTVFRIDRIQEFRPLKEQFSIPYSQKFSEAEFRKRVQFMYSGDLQTVRFKYTGPSLEAILDRLPTARIISEDEEGYSLEAEAYGNGIYMWLRSQGDYVQILSDDI